MMVCSCAFFDFNNVEMVVEGSRTGVVHIQVMKPQKGDKLNFLGLSDL
jgi:hypothetical protein